jgi:hypothetical protein
MGISFSVSVDRWPNVAFVRSLPSLVRLQNFLHLSVPMICAIPLPKHCLILLPMDSIARRCPSQPFSNYSAMQTLQPQLSTLGFLLTILLV